MRVATDVLVVGELNVDIIVTGDVIPRYQQEEQIVDSVSLTLGSSSAITACGLATLGVEVAFAGVVGADPLGELVLSWLRSAGVRTDLCTVDPALPTGSTVILNRGRERALLTHLGTIGATGPEHVSPEAVSSARHLHVGAANLQHRLLPHLPELLAGARRVGTSTSVDPNWDPSGTWTLLDSALPECDVLFANAAEAAALTGESEAVAAARALCSRLSRNGTVAVKCGEHGAVGVDGSGVHEAAAVPVDVVDTTGAGDSFNAGFLAAFLEGHDLAGCLRWGAICGSLSVRGVGGTSAQPHIDEVQAILACTHGGETDA